MAQRHVFGKAITLTLNPLAYDENVAPYSLTSARIYSTRPTNAQIEDVSGSTTGHIGSPVTSGATITGTEISIPFPALVDDSPHSTTEYQKYYVAVNFKWQSGGADVFVVEQILVYRPDALTSRIRVVYSDLTALESKLADLLSTTVMGYKIDLAIEEIDKRLRFQGAEKKWTFNREDLNFCCKYLAVALCCGDLAGEGNQFWWDKAKYYEAKANTILNYTPVNVDLDKSGQPDPTEFSDSGYGGVYVDR